jgi:hypothetical protein
MKELFKPKIKILLMMNKGKNQEMNLNKLKKMIKKRAKNKNKIYKIWKSFLTKMSCISLKKTLLR